MGGCSSANVRMPQEKRYRRAIKLYEVAEVMTLTNPLNRNKCFASGELPLTLAAGEGHEAVVQALINGGAEVNRLDRNGRGPLHIAAYINDIETMEILLENRAQPNKYDNNNQTPLHIASERGYPEAVRLLLKFHADPNESQRALAPLIFATNNSHWECVEALLEGGADPNALDIRGSPAIFKAISQGDINSVQCLLKYGAHTDVLSRDNHSLLSLAAISGNTEVVKAVVEHGCNVNYCTAEDAPALMAATMKGNSDIVDFLIANGADTERRDRKGHTPLFNAAMVVVDYERELYYSKYFSNVYRTYSKYDPIEIHPENYTKCAMSLVQAGCDLTQTWERFAVVFPQYQDITFEQMVLCEVLIQAFGFNRLTRLKLRTFITNLLSISEYGLAKLLYSAGVSPVTEDFYLLSVRSELNDRAMFRWVKRLYCRPRRLKDLCRKRLRELLAHNVLYGVERLDMPVGLKEYLCIMDTEHYSSVDDT